MENLNLTSDLSHDELANIEGGCTSWFCVGYVYEFWDGVVEGFHKGASDGAQFLK